MLARKFGVNCKNLTTVPGQVNKQEMMNLSKQIQGPEDAIIEFLHAAVNSAPKDFPF